MFRRTVRTAAGAAFAAAALLGMTACGSGSSGGGGGEIVLGMIVPTSGGEAASGTNMRNGAQLAVDEINAAGGVLGKKLKLNVQDEACAAESAVAAANKLVSAKVVVSVGGYCSGATLPTREIFNRANIPMVIPAANSDKLYEDHLPNVFLINGTGTQQAQAASDWITKRGATKVAIMNGNDAYSKNIADLTAALVGSKLTANESYNPGESDYSAAVTAALKGKPDFIYLTGYYQESGLIIRQLKDAGYTGDIMVGDGSVDAELIKIAGESTAQGVFATMTQTPKFIPGSEDWISKYKAKFKSEPGPYSTQSYDAVRVAAEAITKANSTDGKAIMAALDGMDGGFSLFSGPLKFTSDRTLQDGGFVILVVKGSEFDLAS
jgi:branched-chain amino acid transport system substrate-binding protein